MTFDEAARYARLRIEALGGLPHPVADYIDASRRTLARLYSLGYRAAAIKVFAPIPSASS